MKVTGWTDWVETIGDSENDCLYEIITSRSEVETDAIQAVIQELRDKGYHFSGHEHQNCEKCVPIIDGKYVLQLTQRDWGALMYEAFPNEDYSDFDGYEYLKWYCIIPEKFGPDVKFPDGHEYNAFLDI